MKKLLKNLFTSKKEEVKKKRTLTSSLAPKVLTKEADIEKVQPYLDKLNETIDTKGINNIALTGGYGSGKSTIISTFKELNPQYEFLNISLASFNKKKSDDKLSASEKKIQKEELERLLEVSILQQIFYHVKPEEIPESRFKRIINIPDWKIWGISIGFILWVSSSILLLKYDYLNKINPNSWSTEYSFDWFALFTFGIAFLGLGLFSKLIIKLFSNSKINKVNIKGELELGDNVSKSVFNEHLEEILYFFEKTRYNVVVIEDLDRFDSTDIFTKLREINILLNNAIPIGREINFVYAVGDDLFDDKKERVKFFEYIIPVIPFINSSNADEQLRTLIKESGLDENIFTKEFISDVTTFIDDIDMRLLTNIFHEFVIYRKTLKPEFIKKNDELFAMITYKNIDPKDFTELNKKEGKLYDLINNKETYIKKMIIEINDKIILKNSELIDLEKHTLIDIKELRAVYINKILSKLPYNTDLYYLKIEDLLEDDGFEKMLIEGIPYTTYQHYNGNLFKQSSIKNLNFIFSDIENEVNSAFTYEERVEFIESKHNNKIDVLKKEVEKLKSDKSEIENWNLKEIFNEIDINEYLNDFSNNGLLRNFILNGYINENYNDYISLFHEVSITKEDFTFERNVKGGYSTDFNFKLSDKIENLVEKIDEKYFKRETILNFDLLDYLGNNYNKHSNKYDSIIRLLSNEKEKSIQFIDEYIKNEDRPIDIFIEKLVENWIDFWDYIYSKSTFTKDKVDKYLELIIRFSKNETILEYQNKESLKSEIEEKSNFLSLIKNTHETDYFDKITQLLKELDVEFYKLDNPNEETEELLEYVFKNKLYKINKDNLLQMFLLFGKESLEEEFNDSNYSTILKSECKPLIDYINTNINTYVEDVYLKLEQNNSDNENVLLKLLNNEKLNEKLKIKIIQKVEIFISDLSKVEDIEIKKQLLTNIKVVANWKNVIDYYNNCENKIDEKLIEYLNKEEICNQLSELSLLKDDKNFERSLLVCNEIENNTYKILLDSIYYRYNQLSFENLSEIKVVSLAERKLTTTKSNYDKLRENFADNHIKLIERDFDTFFEKIEDFETDINDTLMILKSEKITNDNKFNLISKIDQQYIIDNKEIAKIVKILIKQKNSKIELEFITLTALVKSSNSIENNVKLINLYINDLNNDNTITLIKNINSEYEKLFKKGFPTYDKNDYNDVLLKKLKTKKIIKNYYDDKWNDSNFRVTTNH